MTGELTAERWRAISRILEEILELPEEQRRARLGELCQGDAYLHSKIEALVAAEPRGGLLDGPAAEYLTTLMQEIARNGAASPSEPEEGGAKRLRFLPGTVISGRYRMATRIGRGGMGEVFRADDLKLGQEVALKFLPEELAEDEQFNARLLKEIKLARQIAHPNVCRVYDIGESDGQLFLSMEFIDGEDLAALLKRIGRLPEEKAIQIAQQLCAGLAAAHDQGILHRDLKPGNIMLDEHGRVRITDFGLAGLAEEIRGGEVLAGTPAYMAPEQLTGEEVSIQSDLYALGLVLYELFTGRRPYEGETRGELLEACRDSTPATPSRWVEGLEPTVEKAILRCLEASPGDRPASARAVGLALPGGDPLAAALAAGETPSPELVAASGERRGLSRGAAWICLAGALFGAALVVWLSKTTQLTRLAEPRKSAEVLAERAGELARELSGSKEPGDRIHGFGLATGEQPWVTREGSGPISFWYRESPEKLVTFAVKFPDFDHPPQTLPGMVRMRLDLEGRLLLYESVPARNNAVSGEPREIDWRALLEHAGLDPASAVSVEPRWTPPAFADRRLAWQVRTEGAGASSRIEVATLGPTLVSFRAFPATAEPPLAAEPSASPMSRISGQVFVAWYFAVGLAGVVVAFRHYRLGRGDRKGALRLAIYLMSLRLAVWLVGAHHVAVPSAWFQGAQQHVGAAMWRFAAMWALYMALEPYVRRLWPRILTSWIRLLDGRFTDPLIGRDLLAGCLYGLAGALLARLYQALQPLFGYPPPRPESLGVTWSELAALGGRADAVASLLLVHDSAIISSFFALTGLVLLRLLLRIDWLALTAFFIAGSFMSSPLGGSPAADLLIGVAGTLLYFFVLFRFGLLATLTGWTVDGLLRGLPLTFDLSAWYAYGSLLALAVFSALAVYGFKVSLAGQSIFGGDSVGVGRGLGPMK